MEPFVVNAGNGGPFTLDGTRTYVVGSRDKVIIDPGPAGESHLRALLLAVESARSVAIVVTHWHDDHAGLAPRLSRALGGIGVAGPGPQADRALLDGETVETDQGQLIAVATPGHAEYHHVYHWAAAHALFVGDLVLGEGDTTWVGEYPGCVADYLASLDRLETLRPKVLYPGHGAPIQDVAHRLGRYREHRLERIEQVAAEIERDPGVTASALTGRIYGSVPDGLMSAARQSVEVIMHHLSEADA